MTTKRTTYDYEIHEKKDATQENPCTRCTTAPATTVAQWQNGNHTSRAACCEECRPLLEAQGDPRAAP